MIKESEIIKLGPKFCLPAQGSVFDVQRLVVSLGGLAYSCNYKEYLTPCATNLPEQGMCWAFGIDMCVCGK